MTTTQPLDGDPSPRLELYAPATAKLSSRPGRIEQFLTTIYRRHRLRGGVTARAE